MLTPDALQPQLSARNRHERLISWVINMGFMSLCCASSPEQVRISFCCAPVKPKKKAAKEPTPEERVAMAQQFINQTYSHLAAGGMRITSSALAKSQAPPSPHKQ